MHLEVLDSPAVDDRTRGALRGLWRAAFAGDFSADDAAHAFGGVHVIVREGAWVVAHASAVPRSIAVAGQPFAAGYVEAVATAPDLQGQGLGTRCVQRLNALVRDRFDLGVLSTGSPGFYSRLGWERWRGPSYVVRDGTPERTEDEDDGLMVLRFGVSAGVDLGASIACHDRGGDAW